VSGVIESRGGGPARLRLRVEDDLQRSRLTVFFRLLLAIPHFIWIFLWSIAALLAAIATWLAALAIGRPPDPLHRFLSAYVRYGTHLNAYLYLVANPYPGFTGEAGSYPIDVVVPPPAPQPRWSILLRLVLALPALVLSVFLGGSLVGGGGGSYATGGGGSRYRSNANGTGFLLLVCAVLGWFASLARGRMPRGLRDAGAYSVGYGAQTLAYALLLTGTYPTSDPLVVLADVEPPPPHPVMLVGEDDLRRSRVTVFFRLLLSVPHVVWLFLWTIAALFAGIAIWFGTLAGGTPPAALHRFLSAYVRYGLHVYAFLFLVANPFPGFAGQAGSYPVDVALPPPGPQMRWITFFRIFLAIPAWLVVSALSNALAVAAIYSWFVALVTGRSPEGLRNLSSYALRYQVQFNAYVYLLTDRYPHASPLQGEELQAEAVAVESAAA
jgi:hypothetical protein